MAINEINAAGGVLGRQITYETKDGGSMPSIFATEAQKLVADQDVVNVFGKYQPHLTHRG